MNPPKLLQRLLLLPLVAATMAATSAFAQVTTFSDATNDIAPGIATAGGTLDIVKMEVVDTETDVILTMTVNGNINPTSGGVDWGNFMVGIANQKTPGTTTGNGWGRPINLNAGVTNGVTNGMTHWIGSWVNNGGGSQLWTYGTTNWSGPAALAGFATVAGTQTTITYTVSKESLGVTNGDTIVFDAYSSGDGGGDSAIDALSNPTNSVTDWGQAYTSSATNIIPVVGTGQTRSYTLANTALNTTQDITFSVDMNAQIDAGAFDPETDLVSADWGVEFASFEYLNDLDGDGIYTGTATISAPASTPVAYRFTIEPPDPLDPLVIEDVSRNFTMPTSALSLPTVFFNNIAAYRDVTFTVNMSVQETLGYFNPSTQTVEVRGPFNNWAGTTLTAQGSGLYSGTILVGGTPDLAQNYKFYTAGPGASGYESGGDRSFTFEVNPDGAPAPALILATVFFSNQDVVPDFRPVTFSVDMTVLEAAGGFTAGLDSVKVTGNFNNWDTGGTSYQLADPDENGIYTGTFTVLGAANGSIAYKFFNTKAGAPNGGYESINDRTAVLGPVGETQTLPTVFWNNNSGQTRDITFSVDMSVQVALGLFNPDETDPAVGGSVQVRGIDGNFGTGPLLTREGDTFVYSGTFEVGGDGGTDFSYKFWSPGVVFYVATDPNNTGFEIINQANGFENRSVTLDANGEPMELPVAFFSNQLFYIVGAAPDPFSTAQGTASAAQSVTINGQGLTANIVAIAPTGFEVSADGITYGTTANLAPTLGAVTGTNNLFVRIAASAAAGSPSGNVALTSTGGQPVNIAVTGTVTASGQTFSNWSGGQTLTPALELEYAIGGASAPGAGDGVASVTTVTADTLSITAVVRTNDPTLTVTGQALVDLAVGPWGADDVTVTPQPEAQAPEGCEVQTFSTPNGTDSKKFLRLQTSLPAAP